ncbi:hypothetical protein [Muribaculum intestinale]|uniref:hypothetical protein n=1 Tax=Muribaculum intestinale TaxID=1796646 RepID=UPI00242D68B3|nr:hypothetical protein [Muribaculum intestinale]
MKGLLLILLLGIGASSCSTKDENKNDFILGKYVYEDDAMVIHCNEKCTKLKFGKDDNGHSIYAKHPIDTINLVLDEDNVRVCARCVSDEIYENLISISKRNNTDRTMPGICNTEE